MRQNRFTRSLAVVVLAALVMGCASMTVRSDYDRAAVFGTFRTFAWISGDPLIRPPGAGTEVSPLNIRRIREAIEAELTAKGFTEIDDSPAADFTVSFTVGARDRIEVQSYPVLYHRAWTWGGAYFGPQVDVHRYREGVLSIDIFDGRTRQPVWHGSARKQVTGADISDPEPAIKRAVAAILAKFPPGG